MNAKSLHRYNRERSIKHISFGNIKELLNVFLSFTETRFQVWLAACHPTLKKKLFNFRNVSYFLIRHALRLKYLQGTFLDSPCFYCSYLQRHSFFLINFTDFLSTPLWYNLLSRSLRILSNRGLKMNWH